MIIDQKVTSLSISASTWRWDSQTWLPTLTFRDGGFVTKLLWSHPRMIIYNLLYCEVSTDSGPKFKVKFDYLMSSLNLTSTLTVKVLVKLFWKAIIWLSYVTFLLVEDIIGISDYKCKHKGPDCITQQLTDIQGRASFTCHFELSRKQTIRAESRRSWKPLFLSQVPDLIPKGESRWS